ncbi:aromatic compound dioxygenase [Imleria badia]|nr:aromatic compound dioxygenase [Imleria badia]
MADFNQTQDTVKPAVSNGIPPPNFPLPLPDSAEIITANLLLLHLHAFVRETNLSTEEWMAAIQFLTRVGQTCIPPRQEMVLLSSVFGVTALVGSLNNPVVGGATENSLLGPFHSDDAEDIEHGGSIASEGKGEYMYLRSRLPTMYSSSPGFYDLQYTDRTRPDCRGRLHTAKDGSFGYRAIVPPPYSIPTDGPVGQLLISQGRHNMRASHLHMMVTAPGYRKLVTSLFPEGCDHLASDAVFGVKQSLVVSSPGQKLEQVDDEEEARKRGFPKGGSFKLLKRDIVLLTEEQSRLLRQHVMSDSEESYLQVKDN